MRSGIAMIELIFAIVILGIVMMSAPMLISTATKSGYIAFQQEAIATTSAELGMILTHHWDEGDTDATGSAPILVTLGDTELNEANLSGMDTGRMSGTPTSSHRTFTDSTGGPGRTPVTISTNLGNDGDTDDIDDFSSATPSGLTNYESTTATTGDTVDTNIDIRTTVTYISDAAAYNTGPTLTLSNPFNTGSANDNSNIKHVNVTLTTTNTTQELDKTIGLNAFTCNIGTYQLNQRTLP